MKKYFLTLAVVALGVFTAAAQENPNAPVIEFEATTIDYGTIEQGSDGRREFAFSNSGQEPLVIKNAKGSCGCTVPTWSKNPIASGESGTIKVKYDTRRVGAFVKYVTVTSNAKHKNVRLTIKGTVNKKAAAPKASLEPEKSKVAR
jgi:hypothetical protein